MLALVQTDTTQMEEAARVRPLFLIHSLLIGLLIMHKWNKLLGLLLKLLFKLKYLHIKLPNLKISHTKRNLLK